MNTFCQLVLSKLSTLITLLICLPFILVEQANADWYEAKGQAVVKDGDKGSAKRKATQEALKQAMLFAGASVNSVQQLTNGLLKNEEITIRATGEVKQLELVDEVYNGEIITVTVRADIFPKGQVCAAQSDEKHFSATRFIIRNRRQLTEGNIPRLDEAVTERFSKLLNGASDNLRITYVTPHTAHFNDIAKAQNIRSLSERSNTQFVLLGAINDLSIERKEKSLFTPWKNDEAYRAFGLSIDVYDGINGGLLLSKHYDAMAEWPYSKFDNVDEFSSHFWRSSFGQAADGVMLSAIEDIKEIIDCQPVTGRVLQVAQNTISISLGKDNGISEKDELYLYQAKEIVDSKGISYLQYTLYPGTFVVAEAYGKSSAVINTNTAVIANIQENDFVVKK